MKTFQGALSRGAFVLTAELSPAASGSARDCIRQAKGLNACVDGIVLRDGPGAPPPVSHTALAALLLREGVDATPTMDCRDRNRIALQSEILGLRAVGVTSMVLNRGSVAPGTRQPPARGVFDVGGSELIALARETDETGLLLGTDAAVPGDPSGWDPGRLLQRSSAGARFLRLRPCPDLERLRRHMARLVDEKLTWHFSVFPSLDPEKHGLDDCAQMIREVRAIPGVSGINLVCRNSPDVVGLVRRSLSLANF